MIRPALAGAAFALALAAPVLAASPFDGTWKGDIKSAQFPKKPDVFLLSGGTYSCSSCTPAFSVKADGAFHPIKDHPYIDEAMVKVGGPRMITETDKKNGKVIYVTVTTISPDDKTLSFDFVDTSAANGSVARGSGSETRVAPGPPGSHAVSGSWRIAKLSSMSDNAVTIMLREAGKSMTMTTPTGLAYTAMYGGPAVPIKGDLANTMAAVTKLGPGSFRETDTRKGKVVQVYTFTVAPDGKTIRVASENRLQGTTTTYVANKQ